MDVEKVRHRGISDINKAIELDNSKQYQEAFVYYIKGIGDLLLSAKYTKNKQVKHTIMIKVVGYIDRAEILRNKELKVEQESDRESVKEDSPTVENDECKLGQAIMETKVNIDEIKWEDVVGLDSTKNALYEAVVLPKKFPSMFTGTRQPWSAILMYGPPGTGKSFLARAVASESGSSFFAISSSDIMSKWQGESEKTVKILFETARREAPSVIFIDEIDSIAGARSDGEQESTRRVKNQFLTEMQGVGGGKPDEVLVLAATNTPWSIDSAFRRRFQKRVYVGLPTPKSREIMFERGLRLVDNEIGKSQLKKLSEMTGGFSGSDISNVIRDAVMVPIRKCRNARQFVAVGNKFRPVEKYPNCSKCPIDLTSNPSRGKECGFCGVHCKTMEDLDDETLEVPPVKLEDVINSIENMHKSVSESELYKYDEWTLEFGQDGS